MAVSILLLGESGTGKSTSLRNLPAEQTLVIAPNSKQLPWAGSAGQYQTGKNLVRISSLDEVAPILKQANDTNKFNYVVVEDTTHLMNAVMMSDQFTASKDWSKWNRFASKVSQAMTKGIETFRDDLTVIYIAHSATKEDGTVGLRTSGKLLDNTIDLPSYFTYIMHSMVLHGEDGKLRYVFQTNNNGQYLAKTPMGMFDELYVDNDMAAILKRMHEYLGIKQPEPQSV